MDIFGLSLSLQEIYFAIMIGIAAIIIAFLATWLSHRSDESSCDNKSPNKRRKKTFR